MQRKHTPKLRAYEKRIDALTHRLTTCPMEQFETVREELFKVRDEYTDYLIKLDAKRTKKVA